MKLGSLTALLAGVLVTAPAGRYLALNPVSSAEADQAMEMLYLPDGTGLELISFGYRNALANVLWFNTVNYFGKHYRTDHNYRWFNHMCRLVIRLDPRVYDPYYFCGTLLAWEADAPEHSVAILSRAVEAHPADWFFFYLRGFYRMYFLKDDAGANEDFVASSKREGAPAIVARIAARKMSELNTTETAIEFLNEMISKTQDGGQREALEARLRELMDSSRGRDQ